MKIMKSINLTSFLLCVILFLGDIMEIINFPDEGYYERLLKIIMDKLLGKNE